MKFAVRATEAALEDVDTIQRWIAEHGSPLKAERWVERLRSGSVTVHLRVRNTRDDVDIKAEVKAVVVAVDRNTKDVGSEVSAAKKTVELRPGSSQVLTFSLRWATARWQPSAEEMPAVSLPTDDDSYQRGSIAVWRRQ